MERKNVILFCATLIVIVLIVCGTLVYMSSVKGTTLSLKDATIEKGEKLTFVLKDDNGNPLKNKTVQVIVSRNKNDKFFNLTTNKRGVVKLPMKKEGTFKVSAIFEGELLLNSSNLTKKVVVKEKYVAPAKSFPYYNAKIGYYRMTGIEEMESAVIEAKNGGYYVIGGDSSVIPYDGISIDSSYDKSWRTGNYL